MQTIQGKVESVLIAPQSDVLDSEARSEIKITFEGCEGDRHAGMTMPSGSRTPYYTRGTAIRNSRQISIVSCEELVKTAEIMKLPRLLPEWLGANLCLSGIPDLSHLPVGTRLFFDQGVTLVVEAENKPCSLAGKSIEANFPDQIGLGATYPKAGMGLRGIVAWVEKPGLIRPGETVKIKPPAPVTYTWPE
jgi:hypothetical protein